MLLLTWHNYPEGENVIIQWETVWTFSDKEITSHSKEFADDPEMRLKQLIAFAPDSEHSTVTGF